jgi:hypothetical protein
MFVDNLLPWFSVVKIHNLWVTMKNWYKTAQKFILHHRQALPQCRMLTAGYM